MVLKNFADDKFLSDVSGQFCCVMSRFLSTGRSLIMLKTNRSLEIIFATPFSPIEWTWYRTLSISKGSVAKTLVCYIG